MKLYFLRHQAAGVLHEYPFAERPTEAQMAPLRELLQWRHGAAHPRSGQAYWLDVLAVEVLGPSDVPAFELPADPKSAGNGSGTFGELKAHGKGHVKNPKG